jgi:transposase-like protein
MDGSIVHILAGIMSLPQYVKQYHDDKAERLARCPGCGRANPRFHGCYSRKSDRINPPSESLNLIFIQRYYCPGCGKTCSVLPECIPPVRWYLWETQQAAILLFWLQGSARAVEKQITPSRHTIKRWVAWLIVQFKSHKNTLCTHFPSLGLLTDPIGFWKHVFDKLSLSTAMRLCHVAGVAIP